MGQKWKVTYALDRQRRLISTIAEGSIVFGDIRDHQDRLLADPDFDPTFDQLIYTIPAIEFVISAEEARNPLRPVGSSPPSRARAFVAIKPHIIGLGRMMEIYHEGLGYADVEVFDSIDEAMKWLERR